jgi:hypothetical protein
MATVSLVSNRTRKSQTRGRVNSRSDEREASEFEGLWINVGVITGDENDEDSQSFNRLPRGIAVEDLVTRKVYDNMDPDFASSVRLMNQIIEMIRRKGLELDEGESIPLNLSVQLYRRQEEAQDNGTDDVDPDLEAKLFG